MPVPQREETHARCRRGNRVDPVQPAAADDRQRGPCARCVGGRRQGGRRLPGDSQHGDPRVARRVSRERRPCPVVDQREGGARRGHRRLVRRRPRARRDEARRAQRRRRFADVADLHRREWRPGDRRRRRPGHPQLPERAGLARLRTVRDDPGARAGRRPGSAGAHALRVRTFGTLRYAGHRANDHAPVAHAEHGRTRHAAGDSAARLRRQPRQERHDSRPCATGPQRAAGARAPAQGVHARDAAEPDGNARCEGRRHHRRRLLSVRA